MKLSWDGKKMTDEYLPKEELEIGQAYEVDGRNFTVAIWTGEKFAGVRNKFGQNFIDEEIHWDDDDHYGTVKPLRKLG